MSMLEWVADALVLLMLGLCIPVSWRLHRSLTRVRSEREALNTSAADLTEATRAAEAALRGIRASTEQAGRQLGDKVAVAEPLRDDLRYLIERAESLADRLESAVQAARPLAQSMAQDRPPLSVVKGLEARSATERQLLQALAKRS
ncbi:DUF6468 domain-containing protein [Rhodovarius lipocyclicus]|uniref:DUF6468 domain-containing protein n=1 Tax=Rhodovarius lipocyclicus TaxID=268410 RepID=UPI00135ACD52|nr:DUF6468 domain-containing protein [Rhodovarius lipocyclicus]